jgi:hypothetical protein
MVDGVIMERLRKGRRLRTIGGGGGGRRVERSGGAIIFCRGGNFCDRASFSIQHEECTYLGTRTKSRATFFAQTLNPRL